MINAYQTIKALVADRRGVTALEYAVVASVILGVAIAGFTTLGTKASTMIGGISL